MGVAMDVLMDVVVFERVLWLRLLLCAAPAAMHAPHLPFGLMAGLLGTGLPARELPTECARAVLVFAQRLRQQARG